MYVMAEIVHAKLKIIQRKLRDITGQMRRLYLLRRASELEDGNAGHRRRSLFTTAAAQDCSGWRGLQASQFCYPCSIEGEPGRMPAFSFHLAKR